MHLTSLELHVADRRVVVQLHHDSASRTVAHVIALVTSGAYAGSAFYRAQRREHWIPGREFTVLQGGPMRAGLPVVEHETSTVPHGPGTVSLARAEPGTAGAELFICLDPVAPALDPGAAAPMDGFGFAVFGQVIEGLDVLIGIHASPTTHEAPHPLMHDQWLAEPVPFTVSMLPDKQESP